MRHAVIKDGKVIDIIVADAEFVHPEGYELVRNDIARIGQSYDGEKFIHTEVYAKNSLAQHAWRRYADIAYFPVQAKGLPLISFDGGDQTVLMRMAQRAAKAPNMTLELAQYRSGKTVPLSAKQIIDLNEAVTDYFLAQHATFCAVLKAIESGAITDHMQVDHPPPPVPPWPPRFDEKPDDRN